MGCNGQCHLSKQLKEATNSATEDNSTVPSLRLELEFLANHWVAINQQEPSGYELEYQSLITPNIMNFYPEIHKPPC